MTGLNFFASLYDAMSNMMNIYSTEFLRIGRSMSLSFGLIIIMFTGISMMFQPSSINEKVFQFLKVMGFVVLVNTLARYYLEPVPGIGYSFIGLIESQTGYLMRYLDANSVDRVSIDLDNLLRAFQTPSVFAIFPGVEYVGLIFLIWLGKLAALWVIGFGLIAEKIIVLLGVMFVPFLLVPSLSWMFWGWLKSLITASFFQVVTLAWMVVGERFLTNVLSGVPPTIAVADYATWGFYVAGMVLFYALSVFLIPAVTTHMFSGGVEGGGHLVASVIRVARAGR